MVGALLSLSMLICQPPAPVIVTTARSRASWHVAIVAWRSVSCRDDDRECGQWCLCTPRCAKLCLARSSCTRMAQPSAESGCVEVVLPTVHRLCQPTAAPRQHVLLSCESCSLHLFGSIHVAFPTQKHARLIEVVSKS